MTSLFRQFGAALTGGTMLILSGCASPTQVQSSSPVPAPIPNDVSCDSNQAEINQLVGTVPKGAYPGMPGMTEEQERNLKEVMRLTTLQMGCSSMQNYDKLQKPPKIERPVMPGCPDFFADPMTNPNAGLCIPAFK